MISKNRIKLIHSLEKKKYRMEEGLFVAEGPKMMEELLSVWTPTYIAATEEWISKNNKTIQNLQKANQRSRFEYDVITQAELEKASLVRTPQQVIGLFQLPKDDATISEIAEDNLCLALDGVQDPGNMGTIIRLADWFGIKHIFCSTDTVDAFSPKATQATMGAISRVRVHYINLSEELLKCNAPIYGTHLDGDNIYKTTLTAHGVIIMGNEGKGVSPEVSALVNSRLYIPPYPANAEKVESLNVAIATAVVCAEFRRRS